jgi:glutamyl-tRNA synthetase
LPEAVANYLLRLGWGRGDIEVIPMAEAVKLFELSDIGRGAARFDYKKLLHINSVYLHQADNARLLPEVFTRLEKRGIALSDAARTRITALIQGLKERARTLEELADAALFCTTEGHAPPLEPKAAALLTPEAQAEITGLLASFTAWDAASLEAATRAFAETAGRKLGQVAQPLRAAVTGSTASPPLFDVLAALGEAEVRARIATLRVLAG